MNNDDDERRYVRHHGKHHKTAPAPNLWQPVGTGAAATDDLAGHRRRHDVLAGPNRNGTAATAAAVRTSSPHVIHAASPDSMCYTTNEVLVIIAVTCFLNFAFILLIMTCVHCFTDPSHHKKWIPICYQFAMTWPVCCENIKHGDVPNVLVRCRYLINLIGTTTTILAFLIFGSVAYAELGDELFDTDMVDGDTVTLLNPTKSTDPPDYSYEKKRNEYDLESCASYQNLMAHHDRRCKSRRRSEEDLFLFE